MQVSMEWQYTTHTNEFNCLEDETYKVPNQLNKSSEKNSRRKEGRSVQLEVMRYVRLKANLESGQTI